MNCGKKGHKASECRNKKKKGKEGSTSNSNPNSNSKRANVVEEKSEDIVAMISEWSISMITEANMAAITKTSDWWLDSAATIHVCNDISLFSAYKEEEDGNSILMRNHNAVKVHGKGRVELQFTYGKKSTLMNVF